MDDSKQVASLSLNVDPEALRSIISSGPLLEFADTVAAQAAAQISAQLVQHVADGALKADGLRGGVSAAISSPRHRRWRTGVRHGSAAPSICRQRCPERPISAASDRPCRRFRGAGLTDIGA